VIKATKKGLKTITSIIPYVVDCIIQRLDVIIPYVCLRGVDVVRPFLLRLADNSHVQDKGAPRRNVHLAGGGDGRQSLGGFPIHFIRLRQCVSVGVCFKKKRPLFHIFREHLLEVEITTMNFEIIPGEPR
jgi:hypothetical protein